MHNAPSVSYPVGRSRLAPRLLLGVWAVGAAGVAAWSWQFSGAPWRTGLIVAALLLAGMAAWRAARLGEGAQLLWDGQHWTCSGSVQRAGAQAFVHLDLQSLMLVRLCAPGRGAAWLWLERGAHPSRWLDIRRALHAGRPTTSQEAAARP
jgi:toxin CptA